MQSAIPLRGSIVWIRRRPWQVERVTLCRHILRLDVRDRCGQLTFLAPFDHAIAEEDVRRAKRRRLRAAAARLSRVIGDSPRWTAVNAAVDARLDVHGYQLEPVLAVLRGARRVLIADEVGLGKTLQAGLVLAEIERRQGSIRALVLCPSALRAQWEDELTGRFSLACQAADRDALVSVNPAQARGDTLWKRPGVWIASIDFVKQPHVFDTLPLTPWDVVIIDEAHDASGTTERHEACHELACRARHVILLTATPHSGDGARFERLMKIGQLGGDALTVFRRSRAILNRAVPRHVRWHYIRPLAAEARLLDALAAYERTMLGAAAESRAHAALLLLSVFRKRALSTSHALAVSLERRLEWLGAPSHGYALDWMQPSLDFEGGEDDVSDMEREALTGEVGLPCADERVWLRRLLTLARTPDVVESKVRCLETLLRRGREPAVVFTEFIDSLDALSRRLARSHRISTLHGRMPLDTRRDELLRFEQGHTSVLLATDVAAQGLNLQKTARWVVNLELPWNPARLEQRIGRVDRIGQTRTVHATLLISRHPMESTLLSHFAERTLAARQALPSSLIMPLPDLTVAERLFQDQKTPVERCSVQLQPCTELLRPARAVARFTSRRRALRARWRGPAPQGRPVRARIRTRTAERVLGVRAVEARVGYADPADRWSIGVFSVPIVDACHHVLERHLLIVRGLDARRPLTPTARRAIDELAARALESRRRRLATLVGIAGRSLEASNVAVARRLEALCRPEETQAGLFSRSPQDAFERGREHAGQLKAIVEDSIQSGREARVVTIGRPKLEIVLTR